jgi:hypothetical protein
LGQIVSPVEYPEEYIGDISKIRRLWQNGWPTCGANAGATLKAMQEFTDVGLTDGCSPRFLWKKIKEIDGVPADWGTDMRSILKALYSCGVCNYSLLPEPYGLSMGGPQGLSNYTNVTTTPHMEEDAQEKIINGYAFLPSGFTLSDLKRAIYQSKQVVLLIRCDEGFFGTNLPTFTSRKYGHFVVAYGYDRSGIYILDSTEQNPEKATKIIYGTYFPFIQEAGTGVDAPTEEIRKLIAKKNLLTKIVELYKQAVALALQIKK